MSQENKCVLFGLFFIYFNVLDTQGEMILF